MHRYELSNAHTAEADFLVSALAHAASGGDVAQPAEQS